MRTRTTVAISLPTSSLAPSSRRPHSRSAPAGSTPRLLDFHSALLTQLAFQHNGSLLAAGCNEGLLSLWRAHNETLLATTHLGSAITQISWAPSNRRFAAATASGLLTMIDATAV